MWDVENGARDLQSLLESDFDLDLTGWNLAGAYDVSADGTVIVRRGFAALE